MKKTIALICGGRSGEHEVSLRSAFSVYRQINRKKYQVAVLAVDKKGRWHFSRDFDRLVDRNRPLWKVKKGLAEVLVAPSFSSVRILAEHDRRILSRVDVFFPLIHGTYGEDGCWQGLLEIWDVPYVGAGVLGSAVAMDKEMTKRLLAQARIPAARFAVVKQEEKSAEKNIKIRQAVRRFGFPLFIKPASLGSSVGVSKANNMAEARRGIKEAFQYDHEIIIEEFVRGRELECSVLGNTHPVASWPGEIKSVSFYSYHAKYLDPHQEEARLLAPASLSARVAKQVQQLSVKTFQVLKLRGMARVDFFLQPSGRLVVNEANTIPGFTDISMYPKLWEVSGLSYARLLDRLIVLAREEFQRKKKLKRDYDGN